MKPKKAFRATCGKCGSNFPCTEKRAEVSKSGKVYCSRVCSDAARRFLARKRCEVCGAEIARRSEKHRFCSNRCRSQVMRGPAHPRWNPDRVRRWACLRCKSLVVSKVQANGVYCSKRCADAAHAERMEGPGNSNYVHGRSHFPYPLEFVKAGRAVRKREGRACFLCGTTEKAAGRQLSVHHVDYDKGNNALSNLVGLCPSCHGDKHPKGVRGRLRIARRLSRLLSRRYGYPPRSMTYRWLKTITSSPTGLSSTTAS